MATGGLTHTRLLAIEMKLYCYVCFYSSYRDLLASRISTFIYVYRTGVCMNITPTLYISPLCFYTYMYMYVYGAGEWTRTWTCELRFYGYRITQCSTGGHSTAERPHSSVQDQHFEGKTLLMVNVFGVRYCIGMGLPHVATTQWSRKLPLLSPDLSLCAFITNASTQQLHYSQSVGGFVGQYS